MSIVDEYLQANAEYEAAKKEFSGITDKLKEFTSQLYAYPEATFFNNCKVNLPMDITIRGKGYDANDWPTPDHIQQAIARRFEARVRVVDAWSKVPKNLQQSLVPPKHQS